MTRRGLSSVLQVPVLLASVLALFTVANAPARQAEAALSAALVAAASPQAVSVVAGTTVQVQPFHDAAFRAAVTPSCSALAPVLALLAIAAVLPRSGRGARARAAACAVAVVAAGNVLRIATSLAVGLYAGRSSLVLFHDWVGSVFSVAYTLCGFVLMVRLVLPAESEDGDRVAPAR